MARKTIAEMSISQIYPYYIAKVEKKGRAVDELEQIVCWLTGYTPADIEAHIARGSTFQTFFDEAPAINPNVHLITGVICGVRVEDIEDPLVQKARYLDKLVDELAKGKAMDKILRA